MQSFAVRQWEYADPDEEDSHSRRILLDCFGTVLLVTVYVGPPVWATAEVVSASAGAALATHWDRCCTSLPGSVESFARWLAAEVLPVYDHQMRGNAAETLLLLFVASILGPDTVAPLRAAPGTSGPAWERVTKPAREKR